MFDQILLGREGFLYKMTIFRDDLALKLMSYPDEGVTPEAITELPQDGDST